MIGPFHRVHRSRGRSTALLAGAIAVLAVTLLAVAVPVVASPEPPVTKPSLTGLSDRMLDAAGLSLAPTPGGVSVAVSAEEALAIVMASGFPQAMTQDRPEMALQLATNDPLRGGPADSGDAVSGYQDRVAWIVSYPASKPSLHQPLARSSDAPAPPVISDDACRMVFVVDAVNAELLDAIQVCDTRS